MAGGRRSAKRNKYLGRGCKNPPCVRDIGRRGLDSPREFRGIMRRILRDYRAGRISRRTARGRLLLLYRLTYPRHNRKVSRMSARARRRIRDEIRRAMRKV